MARHRRVRLHSSLEPAVSVLSPLRLPLRTHASAMPSERAPDSTLALLSEGYEFVRRRARTHGTDVFQARLLLQPTICMTGVEAARLFYDDDRLQRATAAPGRMKRTLVGVGGVQGLDDEDHRHRKAMFMSLMTPESVSRLADLSETAWRHAIECWRGRPVVLLEEAEGVLCRAVCAWAGVPLADKQVEERTHDLTRMIASGGRVGPAHWAGRLARGRAERWVEDLVWQVRTGMLPVAEGTPLALVAQHRDRDGVLLDERVAAVEVLNLLRPTVAVARYIAFLGVALQVQPEARTKLRTGECRPEWFVHEVRRFFPVFPLMAGRTRESFEWQGYHFPEGRRVLLDIYGTNRDARAWADPDRFRPQRFRDWQGDPFALIPQGGGDHRVHHRCPGEWFTIELMKVALRLLVDDTRYEVPPQDMRISLRSIPTQPNSGFVISNVREV